MSYQVLKFDDYTKAGGKGTYQKGVLTTPLSRWSDFYGEVKRFQDHKDYVWRGQRRDRPLKASFDRLKRTGDREELLKQHLDEFKRMIMGRRGANPPQLPDDDLWALGQHQGLETPLLDWTMSPFAAAYFAFRERGDDYAKQDERKRAVYGLNRDIKRWYRSSISNRIVSFPEITTHENARFLAQSGVFTKALNGQEIKKGVQRCYKKTGENRIILVEILIPDSGREECLRDLNQMNINHASLFPDIHGSAIYCNLQLEIYR